MASKITIDRGTTVYIGGIVKDGSEVVDITGATVYFTVKATESSSTTSDSDAMIAKTVTSLPLATSGTYQIKLDPADTATIAKGSYFYDVKIKYSNGDVNKLDEGRFNVDVSPTNRAAV